MSSDKSSLPDSSKLSAAAKAQKNIYCVSGLGADRRVFTKLQFEGYRPVHLEWLSPETGETLPDYAKRLAAKIEDEKPILIGLSFGGIVAIEIAKQIAVEKLILISSVKTTSENPWYFRLFSWFPVHLLIPFKSLLWAVYWVIDWFFSLENAAERQLFKTILADTDANFLRWAINRVVLWRNETIPQNTYHIHGTGDRIFPMTFISPDVIVERGGHFMIMNRAERVSQIIDRIISKRHQQADVL